MKRKIAMLLGVLCVLALAGCGAQNQEKIVGTWHGDGTLDILGAEAPVEFSETLTFAKDGTLMADILTPEGVSSKVILKYSMTDDTLTFTKDGVGTGIGYQLVGDTLTIKTGGEASAIFTRGE